MTNSNSFWPKLCRRGGSLPRMICPTIGGTAVPLWLSHAFTAHSILLWIYLLASSFIILRTELVHHFKRTTVRNPCRVDDHSIFGNFFTLSIATTRVKQPASDYSNKAFLLQNLVTFGSIFQVQFLRHAPDFWAPADTLCTSYDTWKVKSISGKCCRKHQLRNRLPNSKIWRLSKFNAQRFTENQFLKRS